MSRREKASQAVAAWQQFFADRDQERLLAVLRRLAQS